MDNLRFASKSRFMAVAISLVCIAGLFFLAYGAADGQLWMFRYNPYALLSAVTFVFLLGLLLYFIRKPARADERIWLSFYIGAVCLFAGAEMMQRFSPVPDIALFWTTLSAFGVAAAPVAIYLFALAYTNQSDRRFPGTTLVLLMTALIVAFFYGYTDLIFNSNPAAMKLYPWGYNNDAAAGLIFTILWLDVLLILSFARLIHFRRRTRNVILRKQSLIFILGVAVPMVGATIADAVLPLLGINSIPPLGVMLSTATAVLFTYGVLRYQLLTISPTLFSGTILSIMHEAVVVTDEKFKLLYLNAEAEKLLGVQSKAEQQPALPDFIPTKPMREKFLQAFAASATSQGTVDVDHIDIGRQGAGKTPVKLTSSRLPSVDLEAYVMVLTDITADLRSKSIIERTVKLRTEELHQARAYLLASINSLGQGFILVNHQTDIVLSNGAARRLLSKAGGNAALQHLTEAAAMKWDINLPQEVQAVLNRKQSKQLSAATSDGLFYTIFITPVLSDTSTLGAAVIIEDVTEQRILERSKEEFFSIASHELRTPLTAIRGNMDMILDNYKDQLKDPGLHGMVEDVHTASVRLIAIVNDFLDSTRLEQGKMKFTIRPTQLKPVLAAVKDSLQTQIAEQHTTVVLGDLDNLPLARVDAERLKQILYNMLHNAVKYTPYGTVTISGETKGRQILIRISDTGVGISPENQQLLFHKFQQASDDILTRESTEGTGLGLYISKLLATNMNGDVILERSEAGKGSTFVIKLPVATKERAAGISEDTKAKART